jgi:hypothetical protein
MLERSTSLNHIYKSTKALPYVYLCKEKHGPLFYIGYRYANYAPSTEDFGTHYFTSNDYVRNNFDKFEHTIIAEFFDKKDAYAFESTLIKELRSDYLINTQKNKKTVGTNYKPKVAVDLTPKMCALPGCNKIHTNWRSKCCCLTHSKKYAGIRSHQN